MTDLSPQQKLVAFLTIFFLSLFSLFLLQHLPIKINVILQVPGCKINWLYMEKVIYFSKMQTLGLFPHGAEPGRAKHWRFPWQELSPQSFVYLGQSLYLSLATGSRQKEKQGNRDNKLLQNLWALSYNANTAQESAFLAWIFLPLQFKPYTITQKPQQSNNSSINTKAAIPKTAQRSCFTFFSKLII